MQLPIHITFETDQAYRIRPLRQEDVNAEYVSWLNDPERTRYLIGVQCGTITVASQRAYIGAIEAAPHQGICGLFAGDRLIGTSGIQHFQEAGEPCSIGMMIGPREFTGRGLGSALVWCMSAALLTGGLVDQVWAGVYDDNAPSLHIFRKCGYDVVEHAEAHGKPYTRFRLSSDRLTPAHRMGLRNVDLTPRK